MLTPYEKELYDRLFASRPEGFRWSFQDLWNFCNDGLATEYRPGRFREDDPKNRLDAIRRLELLQFIRHVHPWFRADYYVVLKERERGKN